MLKTLTNARFLQCFAVQFGCNDICSLLGQNTLGQWLNTKSWECERGRASFVEADAMM